MRNKDVLIHDLQNGISEPVCCSEFCVYVYIYTCCVSYRNSLAILSYLLKDNLAVGKVFVLRAFIIQKLVSYMEQHPSSSNPTNVLGNYYNNNDFKNKSYSLTSNLSVILLLNSNIDSDGIIHRIKE